MANARQPGPMCQVHNTPVFLDDGTLCRFASPLPGIIGEIPEVCDRLNLPGLHTFHAWLDNASVHLPPTMQVAHYFAAGSKEDVMAEGSKFIARWEGIEMFPYVPGANSGITIGVGYDIGQTSEAEFREDWAQLANLPIESPKYNLGISPQGESKPSLSLGVNTDLGLIAPGALKMFPFRSKLFTPLDRLAYATKGKLSHTEALEYLKEVQDIAIPLKMSIQVFERCSLPKYYEQMVRSLPGVTDLPTGVQVALFSLVYNRGIAKKGDAMSDDIFDTRWEMREISRAVLFKDLVWIYWYLKSMQRVWASKSNTTSVGLIKRRNAELELDLPIRRQRLADRFFPQHFPSLGFDDGYAHGEIGYEQERSQHRAMEEPCGRMCSRPLRRAFQNGG